MKTQRGTIRQIALKARCVTQRHQEDLEKSFPKILAPAWHGTISASQKWWKWTPLGTALGVTLGATEGLVSTWISLALRKTVSERGRAHTADVREIPPGTNIFRLPREPEKGRRFQALHARRVSVKGCSICCTRSHVLRVSKALGRRLLTPPARGCPRGRSWWPAPSVGKTLRAEPGFVTAMTSSERSSHRWKARRTSPRKTRWAAHAGITHRTGSTWCPGAAPHTSSRARAGASPTFAATVGKASIAIRGSLGTRWLTRERGRTSAPSVTKATGGRIIC